MSNLRRLTKQNIISPPIHVTEGLQYEVVMGSVAYGVSDVGSDIDVYGFSIPTKEMVFPHLSGEISGFGNQIKRFEQFQQHHCKFDSDEYDFSIFSIVKYFQLCMENNPNMIDSLFVPRRCVIYTTKIGEWVRENRRMFLHKGSWFKFKGYAYSQLHKMKIKNPDPSSKRFKGIQEFGYDVKHGYHIVRLLNEVEQILTERDIDLERNREQLKSIRRGEWSFEAIEKYFVKKESELEYVYSKSTLRHSPDEKNIKILLLNCLEEYYGSISNAITVPDNDKNLINEIIKSLQKFGKV